MAKSLIAFRKYKDHPRFKQILAHQYLNKDDFDKAEEDWENY